MGLLRVLAPAQIFFKKPKKKKEVSELGKTASDSSSSTWKAAAAFDSAVWGSTCSDDESGV